MTTLCLRELTGTLIVASIPVLAPEKMVRVRLHKVEASGVWVESQDFNEAMLKRVGMAVSTTSLVLFIPFSGIDFIVASVNSTTLSEAALGLAE